jgi:hypothetical protein
MRNQALPTLPFALRAIGKVAAEIRPAKIALDRVNRHRAALGRATILAARPAFLKGAHTSTEHRAAKVDPWLRDGLR